MSRLIRLSPTNFNRTGQPNGPFGRGQQRGTHGVPHLKSDVATGFASNLEFQNHGIQNNDTHSNQFTNPRLGQKHGRSM